MGDVEKAVDKPRSTGRMSKHPVRKKNGPGMCRADVCGRACRCAFSIGQQLDVPLLGERDEAPLTGVQNGAHRGCMLFQVRLEDCPELRLCQRVRVQGRARPMRKMT